MVNYYFEYVNGKIYFDDGYTDIIEVLRKAANLSKKVKTFDVYREVINESGDVEERWKVIRVVDGELKSLHN